MKFVMNKGTKNQKLNILHKAYMIIYSVKLDLRHKDKKLTYFALSWNGYILCENCYEQRHKESEITCLTLGLNDSTLCKICYEQRHKE